MIGDHSAEEPRFDSIGNFRGVRLRNSPSEADRVKGLVRVVEFNEGGDTGGVGSSIGLVVGVEATVEAGARVQERSQGWWVGGEWVQAQRQGDGG